MLLLDFQKIGVIICVAWQRSSVVEQRNHNPLVGGPNPSAATRINKRPDGSFFYSVRRDRLCCYEFIPVGKRGCFIYNFATIKQRDFLCIIKLIVWRKI